MSLDISHILGGWDYEPDQISVRIVLGDDGREKIQMRLDLGLLQMEVDGRPDGTTPEGFESWLDYYVDRQRTADSENPDKASIMLETADCEILLREGIQYYHRYLSFWHLKRYELCARDTNRNLKLFRFVRDHARHDRDKKRFDQWRPYVTMMHSRAVATPLVEMGQIEAALSAIEAGINGIKQFLEEYRQSERADQCVELAQLERWRDQVLARHPDYRPIEPVNPIEKLQEELQQAIAEERFEDAARLRDELQGLAGPGGSVPDPET
ncbi:MAG TPA: UvrB/UvrC motif-containing protein [Pirellulales bacterium]|nr:UvrB/UvrC motif-containing protein [Pirellulales bacterium]